VVRTTSLVLSLALVAAAAVDEAHAQLRRTYWGIGVGFTPTWEVPDWQEPMFDAERMALEGSEFRIGFVRGNTLRGDWGVSFVRRDIEDRDEAEVTNAGTVLATRSNTLIGVEIHGFKPFTTIKERVQIGVAYGAGIGSYRGTVVSTSPGEPAEIVPARVLFSPGGSDIGFQPLGRFEVAGALILGRHAKVRVGAGINFPGQQLVSVTGVFLF
jgi:hypothetical protein